MIRVDYDEYDMVDIYCSNIMAFKSIYEDYINPRLGFLLLKRKSLNISRRFFPL